ncbi:MAG TPA: hypothetical protein VK809_11725, partial [Bacteroidia bacterium]|nr:hypothetical protein [Bacteroidia bacterium]
MKLSSKVYKVIPFLLAFCFMGYALFSQLQTANKEFDKKNFRDNIKGYKKAVDSIKKGDTYYAQGPHYFQYAIAYYLSAEKF